MARDKIDIPSGTGSEIWREFGIPIGSKKMPPALVAALNDPCPFHPEAKVGVAETCVISAMYMSALPPPVLKMLRCNALRECVFILDQGDAHPLFPPRHDRGE